ncbi:MAG: LLM class flavin-dependent oxidoreductase [Candidatus Thorarchaeota archaeon]|nr:LLM class flavin-dependent oxidoreductase [Candidatus Thorarchaeota archaeon]
MLKFGINLPNFGFFGDVEFLVNLAIEVEDNGWDGMFLWDHLLVFTDGTVLPFVDPWIALAAIACNTKKLQFGTLITPIPRRRPWKVAREAVTLDHLSKGRLILGVGIGEPPNPEYSAFGEETNAKVRAEKLDEGLQILRGLWSGEPFSFDGRHYQLKEMTFLPKPYKKSGIPIWVGGGWPHKAPFRRAAQYEGVAPVHSRWPEALTPSNVKDIVKIVETERGSLENFDVVVCGETSGAASEDRRIMAPWLETGITWWLEDIHSLRADVDFLLERIRVGPPDV